jgi:hypothetical protein
MRKRIKQLFLSFIVLLSVLCTKVYANMAIDADEKSRKFYEKFGFLVDLSYIISRLMFYSIIIFLIIIPIIIICKIILLKNKSNEEDKYFIKTLVLAEVLFGISTFFSYCAKIISEHTITLGPNIFIILISLFSIIIILRRLFKKNKN